MYNRLKDIFDNVNEWLKFAEAKHAGLIALNSGIFFGTLTLYKDYKDTIPGPLILFSFFFIIASFVTSFISLFPRDDREIEKKKRPKKANLFFSGDLAMFDKNDLKAELLKQANVDHSFDGLEDDLIHQIIINATIATKKYRLFKVALILLICGLAISVGFSFCLLLML